MKRANGLVGVMAFVGLGLLGCGGGAILGDGAFETDLAEGALLKIEDLATVPVVFGEINRLPVDDEAPVAFGLFELVANAKVKLVLRNGVGDLLMKVYQVQEGGALKLVKAADGVRGVAQYTLTSRLGGAYVARVTGSPHPASLELELTCKTDQCAPAPKPYQTCVPRCGAIGSRSEGWYDGCTGELIRYELCAGCYSVCGAIGSRSEGWYSTCEDGLIRWEFCGQSTIGCVVGGGFCKAVNAEPCPKGWEQSDDLACERPIGNMCCVPAAE
jgi:hypothetical protein